MEDITLRALSILRWVDTVLAEDTRVSGKLLKKYSIDNRLESFHAYNEHQKTPLLINRLLEGETMALVSDAGTPSISDPGFLMVRACREAGIEVDCLPGPTALIPALVLSGFPSDRFIFEGFLPTKKGRQKKIKEIAEENRTVVFYESPHRLLKTLQQLQQYAGHRSVSVSRELSKLHQETKSGNFEEVIGYFQQKPIKGELVVVISA